MLYIVHMKPNPNVEMGSVQELLNDADDWHRLGAWCWVIESEQTGTHWARKLEKFVKPQGEVFVCQLQPSNRNGYKTKKFWEWFRKRADR